MIKVQGLRKRDSYDEIVNYINTEQPLLKYPQRKGTFTMNTPQYGSLLELDGLDEQDEAIKKIFSSIVRADKIKSTSSNYRNYYWNYCYYWNCFWNYYWNCPY